MSQRDTKAIRQSGLGQRRPPHARFFTCVLIWFSVAPRKVYTLSSAITLAEITLQSLSRWNSTKKRCKEYDFARGLFAENLNSYIFIALNLKVFDVFQITLSIFTKIAKESFWTTTCEVSWNVFIH